MLSHAAFASPSPNPKRNGAFIPALKDGVFPRPTYKLPLGDKPQVEKTIKHYEQWIADIDLVMASDIPTDQRLQKMVDLLNQYRIRMDIDLIFDSQDDWLYRQKGQIKLDNSVIEEFLPRLVNVCLKSEIFQLNVDIGTY